MQVGHHIVQRNTRLTLSKFLRLRFGAVLRFANAAERGVKLPGEAGGRLFFHLLIADEQRVCPTINSVIYPGKSQE